jgi:hypothetical protein
LSTPFSDIYIKANILFEDSELLSKLTDLELNELLEKILSKSKSIYFKSCKKDLNDVNDTTKVFNQDLSQEEQWILAMGIRLVWLERQLYKEEKLRDKLTPKDYKNNSPANLIDKLTTLRDNAEKDLKEKVIDYTFNQFSGFN